MAGERILVVDDSDEVRSILRSMVLEPAGYHVIEAGDGVSGLRAAREERPALIILDQQMPGRSGLDVLQTLQQEGLYIPTILMTGHGSEELAVRALRLGVRDYVIKPFELDEMVRAVQRGMAEDRPRSIEELGKANRRLEEQVREFATLSAIGRSVTSSLDLQTVLTRVVEASVFVTRAEEGFLLLTEPGGGDLVLRAAKNVDEKHARALRVPVRDSLAGRVVESGEPLLVTQGQPKVVTGYLVHALVYAPLRAAGRGVIGVLGVTNRREDRPFAERDVHLLSALADYAAVAVENARLYQEAEMERHKMRAVLRETEEGVVILNPRLEILLCNPAAGAALGLGLDVTGRSALETIHQPSLRDLLTTSSRTGRPLRGEVGTRDGRTYSAQVTPVEEVGFVLMMQDITHLKELDRVKSEFVSTVSHDLRTPLTTVRGYVDLLAKVGPLNEQQQEFVARVQKSITHITDLIGDLLDLGRIEAGYDLEMEPLHLEGIIDGAVEEFRLVAEEKGQTLRWKRRVLPLVRGNPRRLRQVIENLLSNGIKYTQEGGWVAVEATEEKGYVVVRVTDNGMGIPPSAQPYIFDRFYRVEREETETIEGTGLGLAIVKSVIEKHNGRIWVDSQPGQGSAFTFVLPVME